MKPSRRNFALAVVDPDDARFGIVLTSAPNGTRHTVARMDPTRMARVRSAVVQAVARSGHQRSVLSPTRRSLIELTEDAGIRLALIALATAPLSKPSRVEAVVAGIDSMTDEEALYWYAYCTGDDGPRALRALRILLAEE